ncbi:MAG: methyltransferase family protein [Gemmatimonadaceae bacterium]
MNLSRVAGRIRLPIGFLLAALYLAFARPQPLTLLVGAAIALCGLAMRAWAAGHIVKNERLATTGPYAHTRNPLYLGSFLIAAGFAIAAHWSLLLLVVAFFALIYIPTMERERARIREWFPDEYAEYERNVPAFVPRPLPWRDGAHKASSAAPRVESTRSDDDEGGFSAVLYMRHGEWKAALGFVVAMAWLLYRMRPAP